jgi:tetratricopeptide (TPR) repeat protein
VGGLLGVLLFTVAVYARELGGEFQFDDVHAVQLNQGIRRLDGFLQVPSLPGAIRGRRFVTDFTFALDYYLMGPAPLSFHVTNLAIHLGAILLVFFFARRALVLAGVGRESALAVAALFALHPLQTQAVAYLAQRSESLASALYLGSLLLLLWAERRGRNLPAALLYLASFGLFVLGIGAKLMVVTLPLAYLLIGLLPGPLQRPQLARLSKRLVLVSPFVLLLVLALAKTAMTGPGLLSGADAGFHVPSLPPWRYFRTEWHVVVTYLRLLFLPLGQNVDWEFPLAQGPGDPAVLACGFLLALLFVGAGVLLFRLRKRDGGQAATGRVVAVGVLWFFLLLAPTSSVIPVADVLMEHRLYLASFGVFLATVALGAAVLERLAGPRRTQFAVVVLAGLCLTLAAATYLRVGLWKSKLLLWTDAVAKSPRKARVHLALANAYREAGQVERAIDEYHTAVDLAAREQLWLPSEIRGKLGAALLSLARPGEAIAEVQSGLAEAPNDSALLGVLAMAHLQQHDLQQALPAAEASVAKATQPAAALRVLGLIRLTVGDREGAVSALEQAVQLELDETQGRLLLAKAYRSLGRVQEACNTVRAVRTPEVELQDLMARELADCPPP